jgi:hypothetical protein
MGNHKQRLDKIESSTTTPVGLRVLFVKPAETCEEALEKAGPHNGQTLLIQWEEPDGKQ